MMCEVLSPVLGTCAVLSIKCLAPPLQTSATEFARTSGSRRLRSPDANTGGSVRLAEVRACPARGDGAEKVENQRVQAGGMGC